MHAMVDCPRIHHFMNSLINKPRLFTILIPVFVVATIPAHHPRRLAYETGTLHGPIVLPQETPAADRTGRDQIAPAREPHTVTADENIAASAHHFPVQSAVTPTTNRGDLLPHNRNTVSKQEREGFAATLPTPVQLKLNQQFGKDNNLQCFKSEACLSHVLLPLYSSKMMTENEWKRFSGISKMAKTVLELLEEHASIDFRPIQGFQRDWREATAIDDDRTRMATAALLHYQGDMASVVRWIGGPHVAAHRDVDATLAFLAGKIDQVTYDHLERIWRTGVPAFCNAEASNANFQEYREYGNHATMHEEPDTTLRTLLKESSRGYCLLFDQRMVHFTLNCHLTPNGLIDLSHPYKNPRPVFDSSFRPKAWCSGINDWTNKTNEPPLHFGLSFLKFITWLYNMRITYPHEEIYPADDDVSGAFRHGKYNPNLVAMHSCIVLGQMVCATGSTFGDNSSPGNFEPVADARKQLAQYLYLQPDTIELARQYFPQIKLAPPPTPEEVAQFVPAERDSLNPGVMLNGHRLPPQFDHHVDDNLYADVGEHLLQAVSASVLALYHILGFPSPDVPNPLSMDKLDTSYTHQRQELGTMTDTRRMEVAVSESKRAQMIEQLVAWIMKKQFNLRDISSLHGSLESFTRYIKWARPLFFALQNAIRRELTQRCHFLKRWYGSSRRAASIANELPGALWHRLKGLIASDQAQLLWSNGSPMTMTAAIRNSLSVILASLQDPSHRWAQPIGFIIERDPHFTSLGDASGLAGGGYCETLKFWFDIMWSPRLRKCIALPSTHKDYVHINSLEFIVVILQLAAVIARLEAPLHEQQPLFPAGVPAQPILLSLTDNTAAEMWSNKVTSRSPQGQQLIGIIAELLRTRNIGLNARHIPGVKNVLADYISRPTNSNLSHSKRSEQIFRMNESVRTWDYFLPSPELLRSISCALSSKPIQGLPSLPRNLGRFVPAGSTISCGATL
jgi:hypothetical protein